MAALFFLAFAYFAVGQAAVTHNGAQTAADSAALAGAREERDSLKGAFLAALTGGDLDALGHLLGAGPSSGGCDADVQDAAGRYAHDNGATLESCEGVADPPGVTVEVITDGAVGRSVVRGTQNEHARATATAVVEPRCHAGTKDGHSIDFSCDSGPLTIDPTAGGFTLDLSDFYSVHLSK
jgi:hypothetical protein